MKALGIIAMIFSIVSLFVPFGGPYLTVIVAVLAAFAAGEGVTYGSVAIGMNMVNILFLSPSLWLTDAALQVSEKVGPGIYLVGVQVAAAIVLFLSHKAYMKKKESVSDDP